MRVVITGGAGFLGQKLAKRLIEVGTLTGSDGQPHAITKLALADIVEAPKPATDGIAVETFVGDLTEPAAVERLFAEPTGSVFHLAAAMSGQCEQDFDLGMRINVDGTRGLLEACRKQAAPPKLVMPASVAVMGGDMPDVIKDDTATTPTNTYGTTKAICELLINDYSRRGFLDGRTVRLPTIVVRPGKPNKAASSFASSIIREPLQGDDAFCPVPVETPMWLMSPRQAVATLIHTHDLPGETLGTNRIITPAGLTVTVAEMVESLRRVGGDEPVGRISFGSDPEVENIICHWAGRWESKRAAGLGFEGDESMEAIIRAFIEDDMVKPGASA